MEVIVLDLQGNFGHYYLEFQENRLVHKITRHRFELESPNSYQTCILGYSQLILKMEVIDLDLQGDFGHFDLECLEIWLVRMITCNGFELELPNLHQICILGYSQLVLKVEVMDLDLQPCLPIISTQETACNVAPVYWAGPAKGCYTSPTYSCCICTFQWLLFWFWIHRSPSF